MPPPEVAHQLEALKAAGRDVSGAPGGDGYFHVVESSRPLPPGYNKVSSRVLVKLPASYPQGHPDMFWADGDLRLASGAMPASTSLEQIAGQQWVRFSWHPGKWNPGSDNLLSYFEFVERRLLQVR